MSSGIYKEVAYYAFIAIGLGTMVYAFFKDSPKGKLKETGFEAIGIIFTQDRDYKIFRFLNSNGVNDAITVRFVTDKKEWISGLIDQPFQLFYTWQYKNGEKVKVYYDRDNPGNFYVDTKQSELMGRIFVALIGISFAAIGIYYTLFT